MIVKRSKDKKIKHPCEYLAIKMRSPYGRNSPEALSKRFNIPSNEIHERRKIARHKALVQKNRIQNSKVYTENYKWVLIGNKK